MPRIQWRVPVLAGLVVWSAAHLCAAAIIGEDFSHDPQSDGWQIFGQTNLFRWDATNRALRITWDSSQPNSYFYHSLGTILTRDDDFSLAFDLRLDDVQTTGYGFEIAVGFLNFGQATQTNFLRGTGYDSPNLVELDYFPAPGNGTISPTLISSNNEFASQFDFPLNLTLGTFYHIELTYTAGSQTLSTTITDSSGQAFGPVDDVALESYGTNFSDFRLDTVAISSYNGTGDPYDSTIAAGTVTNLLITLPPPPVQDLTGRLTNGVWQVRFTGRTNWLYALERSENLREWTEASLPVSGVDGTLNLSDSNPPAAMSFYRVRANRP